MNSYQNTFVNVDQIVLNDDLEIRNRCELLAIKKNILFAKVDYSNCLSNSEVIMFYKNYSCQIACWLNVPEEEITEKITNKDFSELENKLIITNILILENIEDDDNE